MRFVLPLLLLTLCVSSPLAHATVTSLKSMAPIGCSGHRVSIPLSDPGWLPLNHRRGPCSPLLSSESKRPSAMADVLHRDRLRATSIQKGINDVTGAAKRDVTVPTRLGSSLHTLEYVITVGLGTPAVTQTMLMDTGSDVPWVQCEPCPGRTCHPQKDALFNPARSATYTALPCGSGACRGLGPDGNGCSRRRRCQYVVSYGDGSNTTGTYSADRLTLSPSFAVRNFRFGCSHATQLFSDRADGLMGLGAGSQSLVSQMAEKVFSYCLPPTANYSGFLTLGVPVPVPRPRASVSGSSPGFVVTPMYKVDSFYLVLLEGITVAGRRLRVPPSAYAAGAVMDSGTVVTQLPPKAYRALRAAFRKEMKVYPRVPPAADLGFDHRVRHWVPPPSTVFDTCFNLSGGGATVPSVSLVFERGAVVELDQSGTLVDGCLAFASNGDDELAGIIGNVQQRTLEVLYDVGGRTIGFRRGAC